MVDSYGNWMPEKDYSKYPKEQWCDMDIVCNYIVNKGYKPQISMEKLIDRILLSSDFYDMNPKYTPCFDEYSMVNMDSLERFINESGGISAFDGDY